MAEEAKDTLTEPVGTAAPVEQEAAPEAQAEVETQTETETAQTETEPVADKTRELFNQVMPEFAEEYESLSPDAKVRLLAQRAIGLTAHKPDGAPDPTTPQGQVGRGSRRADRPPVPEVKPLDVAATAKGITAAFAEGNSELAEARLVDALTYNKGIGELVIDALNRYEEKFDAMEAEYIRPAKFQAALPKVKGATNGDIVAARKLFETGEATTPEAALKMAVYERMAATNEKPRGTPNPEAIRKGKAIAAAAAGKAGKVGGARAIRYPATEQDLRELLEAESR